MQATIEYVAEHLETTQISAKIQEAIVNTWPACEFRFGKDLLFDFEVFYTAQDASDCEEDRSNDMSEMCKSIHFAITNKTVKIVVYTLNNRNIRKLLVAVESAISSPWL